MKTDEVELGSIWLHLDSGGIIEIVAKSGKGVLSNPMWEWRGLAGDTSSYGSPWYDYVFKSTCLRIS